MTQVWDLGHTEHMVHLADIFIWFEVFAACIAICWLAVFTCAVFSKRRGTMPRFFSGAARHLRSGRHLAWWQHLLLLPLYLILFLVLGLCCLILLPPMYVIEKFIYKE